MAKKVTCAHCGAKAQITDPDDDALERNVDGNEIAVGFTVQCPDCGEATFVETAREEA